MTIKRAAIHHSIQEREKDGKTEYRVLLGNKIVFRTFDPVEARQDFDRRTGRTES